ncbi:hypothetical protein MLD38_035172 [Melastoma candidum]|uniref:Uncharacterized protein n=1 Tax=Melastoma candidum TaxID=119954 RepID=A0ACB9MBY8_9MYRT|nr:hypothetical protein MLD38_035172 [Melastoma candidum]
MDSSNSSLDKVWVFSSSSAELLEKLHAKWSSVEKKPYPAMYSSIFGGIVLDPALMVIPIDDHMAGCSFGSIPPIGIQSEDLISLPTVNPSMHPNSAGCCVTVQERDSSTRTCPSAKKGIASTIPMKSPLFATMKNVNYLPNVLSKMEAEEQGASASIWVDDEGYIAEGPNVNVAFVTHDKELILPSFDKILSGCTANRLLQLAPKLVERGFLKCVKTANLTVEEAKGAAEMMYVRSTLPLLPIVTWDEQTIGDGKVGELTMALSDLIWEDMVAGPETQRIPVPYA